jgi:signal transduction histidine kinase/CheY-like chemotaxis protein/HPt (histidine-containing phosphotransfer) domain-containing protein
MPTTTSAPTVAPDTPQPSSDVTVTERVEFERVATIYAQTPQPLVAGALYSVMVGAAMWGRAPEFTVWAWVAVRLLVCFVRMHETRLFNRDPQRLRRVGHWRMRYLSLMILEGACWSAMGIVFLPHAQGLMSTFLFASVLCIAAVSVFTLISHFPSAVVNLVTSLVPTAAYLGHAGGADGWFIAGGVAVYLGVLLNEAWQSDRRWVEMARMRYETAELAAQRELARRAAEESSNAKSAFLANMSHEIRTPLNGMIGLTELLLQGELSVQQRHYLELSRSSSTHLQRLVDEVLDLSKIRAGGMTLEQTAFSLHELVDELLPVFSARAADKGLQLYSQICPQLPSQVLGDSMRLRQVLSNLVGNAVKFTASGHVLLRAKAVGGDGCAHAAGVRVRFEVCDTGPGIAADKRDLVFQAFAQADTSTARKHGGTGLGLTISANLLELMGSKLQLDSAPGQGCSFHFEIDFASAEPASGQDAPTLRHWPRRRALWIDPQAVTRQWYAAVLRQWEIEVDECESIEQGLARLSSPAARYDLVVTCGSLLSGERAAGWDRLIDCDGGHRLVVLSSPRNNLPPVVRPAATQIQVLMTPVSLRKLNALFAPQTGGPLASVTVTPAADTCHHVLLVEDNDVNALIATAVLRRAGARVARASSGEDAIVAFNTRSFDLVLMDLQMPGMDGFEATRRMRTLEREQNRSAPVPIVALTANALAGDAAACLACGMNDYLSKPVRPEQLLQVLRRTSASANATAPVTLAPDTLPAAGHAEPVFEPAVLARLPMVADGSQPDYGKRVLALFLRGKESTLSAIERALAQGDERALLRQVHTLKSSSATVGALALASLAKAQEHRLRSGESADPGLTQHLRSAFKQLEQVLGEQGLHQALQGQPA